MMCLRFIRICGPACSDVRGPNLLFLKFSLCHFFMSLYELLVATCFMYHDIGIPVTELINIVYYKKP